MKSIDYEVIEDIIGYKFNNKKLLEQAFIRSSYANENNLPSNEVLEFVGDKAIDFVVVADVAERFGNFPCRRGYYKTSKQEGEMTQIKSQIVCSSYLASVLESFGLDEYIMYGKSDLNNQSWSVDSIKEDTFEALVGAIAIDSVWDFEKIAPVVENLLCIDEYFKKVETMTNYVGQVQNLASKLGLGQPYYKLVQKKKDNVLLWQASLEIEGLPNKTKGLGNNQKEAKMEAALKMMDSLHNYESAQLKAKNVLEDNQIFDTINHLVQSNAIEKPEYRFDEDFDADGNPVWTCISKTKYSCYLGYGSTKKEAQKDSLSKLLARFFE